MARASFIATVEMEVLAPNQNEAYRATETMLNGVAKKYVRFKNLEIVEVAPFDILFPEGPEVEEEWVENSDFDDRDLSELKH